VERNHVGIGFKLILLVALTVGVLLATTFLLSQALLRDWALGNARELAETILDQADRRLAASFQELEELARGLAGTKSVRDIDPAAMRDLFIATVLPRQRYLRAVYLGTAAGAMHEWGVGKGFVDHVPSFPPGYDPRRRPWYALALAAGDFAVSAPYHFASVADLGITCVLPVREASGGILGVLGFDILLEDLRGLLEELEIPRGGKAILLAPSGEPMASQFADAQEAGSDGEAESLRIAREAASAGETGAYLDSIGGERHYIVHRRTSGTGWSMVLALPLAPLMAPVDKLLGLVAALDLLLSLLLVLVIGGIIGRIVISPLKGIVAVINRIEAGESSARVGARGHDELGILGGELDKLADLVEQNSRELEGKVRERTAELARLQAENTQLRVVEERERIYRDLHDTIGARLTNIFFCNGVARDLVRGGEPRLMSLLDRVEANCLQAVASVKETIDRTRGGEGAEGDFAAFLSVGVRQRLEAVGLAYDCRIEGSRQLAELCGETLAELEKVVDELVTNVLRHARAGRLGLRLRARKECLELELGDDGVGFDTAAAPRPGAGLDNMRWRVERLGGTISVESAPGTGTRTRIALPAKERQHAD
jgi:signal transduction histidine kinase